MNNPGFQKETAIISLYDINLSGFIIETESARYGLAL
jgi:hypothetical protein